MALTQHPERQGEVSEKTHPKVKRALIRIGIQTIQRGRAQGDPEMEARGLARLEEFGLDEETARPCLDELERAL